MNYWKITFGASLFLCADVALAAPVVGFIASYGSYIAAAVTAVSAISSAQSQKAASKYNAQVAENQAAAARQQAAAQADAQQRDARRRIGAVSAAYGKAGVQIEGSALDVLESSAAAAELDRQNIIYGGALRSTGYGATARLEDSRAAGAMAGGYLSAAGTLFGSAGKALSQSQTTTTNYFDASSAMSGAGGYAGGASYRLRSE